MASGTCCLRATVRSLRARPNHLPVIQRRNIQDVTITRTGKPIIRVQGGRSSLGGHTATVFGATGFLGRYIVNRLARSGCTVVIPFREEMAKRHLKVTGDLGRVVFLEYDLRNSASLDHCVRHSDIVYNLVGRDYETKNFDYYDIHVEGAERIAEAVAKYDVDRFVHVSTYNANKDSPSKFFQSKAQGEEAVRRIFPETTIVRPSEMFGWEDRLLNHFAGAGIVFSSNHLRKTFWPVHAVDVGAALEKMLLDDSTAGETYELFGPRQYQMQDVLNIVQREILKNKTTLNIPAMIRKPISQALSKLFWATKTNADAVTREFIDQQIDRKAKTFTDLGIDPVELEACTYEYLQGYRSNIYYDLPPMTEREKREEKKYVHVIDNQ